MQLEGQHAIVTGASRGIGKAIALSLARRGVNVALVARSSAALQPVADACRAAGGKALAIAADLTHPESPARIVSQTVAGLGGLHILVNNAGAYVRAPVQQADLAEWDTVMRLNFTSVMHLTRQALPHILAQRGGAIVNIASIFGKTVQKGSAIHCASKHALVGFSHALFEDVRDSGIKVCAICPGYVNTDMLANTDLDLSKAIAPQDVANATLYVLSQSETVCPVEITLHPQRSPHKQ